MIKQHKAAKKEAKPKAAKSVKKAAPKPKAAKTEAEEVNYDHVPPYVAINLREAAQNINDGKKEKKASKES